MRERKEENLRMKVEEGKWKEKEKLYKNWLENFGEKFSV